MEQMLDMLAKILVIVILVLLVILLATGSPAFAGPVV
jgi:hypothetical protein